MPNKDGQLTKRERLIINLLKVDTPVNRHQRRQVAKAVRQAVKYCRRSDKTAKIPGSAYARIAAALRPYTEMDDELKARRQKAADEVVTELKNAGLVSDEEFKRMVTP